MFKKLKRFYENHEEAIVTSVIASGCTAIAASMVLAVKMRGQLVVLCGVDVPDEYADELRKMDPMLVTVYQANGKRTVIQMDPAAVPAVTTELTVVE